MVRYPRLVAAEFVHVRPNTGGTSTGGTGAAGRGYVTPGRMACFSRTPRFGPLRSPGTGEHSREALRTAGLTDTEIESLIAAGTVVAGEPMPQALPTAYR